MSTHRHIDKICLVAAVLAVILCVVFMNGEALGIRQASKVMGYEARLFDTERVHTIDIVMDDWEQFLSTCENEEYAVCSVVIDGEAHSNVGIRAKGNTSLSTVSSMNSDRYSFKIEFDQYDNTRSYHGLDKLSLNNLIQDTTMMKDYLTYQMMGAFGAAAPLCSYAYITVNGEEWGLYLAVEGVEDAFLQRNYGSDYGKLYKPDSMSFGGGRGNGQDFDMGNFMAENPWDGMAQDEKNAAPSRNTANSDGGWMAQLFGGVFSSGEDARQEAGGFGAGNWGMGGFGMGSSDVKLRYIDDDPESYSNIFSSAKTDITAADQKRLIASLKTLNRGENIESVVDIDQMLRYFVVHNFVVNGDSYTGSMVHNYYLYEEDGRLAMLPWDYNLAFGTFMGGDATATVNDPIDTPLSVSGAGDKPMVDWIVRDEESLQMYHRYLAEFLETTDFAALIDETAELIAPYVAKDPTKFCTEAEFEAGVAVLREFCLLREESIWGQLNGTIPTTDMGQYRDDSALVDAAHLTLSDMGTMGFGGFGGGFGGFGGMGGGRPGKTPQQESEKKEETDAPPTEQEESGPEGMMEPPSTDGFPARPGGGGSPPDFGGGTPPDFSGGAPPDFGGGAFPGFDGGTPPDFGGTAQPH